jgi:fatty acid desaturase
MGFTYLGTVFGPVLAGKFTVGVIVLVLMVDAFWGLWNTFPQIAAWKLLDINSRLSDLPPKDRVEFALRYALVMLAAGGAGLVVIFGMANVLVFTTAAVMIYLIYNALNEIFIALQHTYEPALEDGDQSADDETTFH